MRCVSLFYLTSPFMGIRAGSQNEPNKVDGHCQE